MLELIVFYFLAVLEPLQKFIPDRLKCHWRDVITAFHNSFRTFNEIGLKFLILEDPVHKNLFCRKKTNHSIFSFFLSPVFPLRLKKEKM